MRTPRYAPSEPARQRAPLGTVIGAVLKTLQECDPMNEYTGFHGDPIAACVRVVHRHGWELPELKAALTARVGEKWANQSGLGEVL